MGNHSLLQGDLPNPGMERGSPPLQADSLLCEPPGKPGALGWPPKMERRWGWGHSTEGSQGHLEGNWQIQIPLHHCHPNVCDLQSLQERKAESTKDMSRTTDVAWLGAHSPAGVSGLTHPLLSHLKGRAVEQGPDPHALHLLTLKLPSSPRPFPFMYNVGTLLVPTPPL